MIHQNEATVDRFVRILLAAGLFALAAVGIPSGAWVILALAVAGILAATAIAGFCPLYAVLHLSTRPIHRS